MTVDLSRFSQDVAAARDERKAAQGKRQDIGSMASIRTALPEIRAQRAAGATWTEIAAALAAQGVSQHYGETQVPITGRRVSALVDSVRRQDERRERAKTLLASRSVRQRQPHTEEVTPNERNPTSRKLRLSADFDAAVSRPRVERPDLTELDLRRSALQGIQDILKKDIP